jgi:hypothetical protein
MERLGSRADPDRVPRAAEGGELLLEPLQLRAEDEPSAADDPRDRAVDLLAHRRVLRRQIAHRHTRVAHAGFSSGM